MTVDNWPEVLLENDVDKKTISFHKTIPEKNEHIFPKKIIEFTTLDKPWMTAQLKKVYKRI